MKRFYLTGQVSFGNRGCEALVRSTVAMLRTQFPDCTIYVPSSDISADTKQWPGAKANGVEFVKAFKSPFNKYWRHVTRLPASILKRAVWPFPIAAETKRLLSTVDAVLSIGGDNYSLDYRIPGLLMGMDGYAMNQGTPVVLWGASVGPFEADPAFVPVVREHLAKMNLITVRETSTFQYLTEILHLTNVELVTDAAFSLVPEVTDVRSFWPVSKETESVLGLNVSPLIERYRPTGEPDGKLLDEVAAFVRDIGARSGVLLIPHVIPLDGSEKNNDAKYMQGLLDRLDAASNVSLMPSHLNAAQTKFVIGQCDAFIGARTHSTIAALSSEIPTGSIAYSVKANGINQDLFGHLDYVIETPTVSAESLSLLFDRITDQSTEIQAVLGEKMPTWRQRSEDSARLLAKILD